MSDQTITNYRAIFENVVEGIFQATPDGRFIDVNPAMVRILGYDSVEEVVAMLNEASSQFNAEPAAEVKRKLEEEGVIAGFEFEAFRKDGEQIWLCMNARLVRDEKGQALFRVGTIVDITAQKNLEQQLRHSLKMDAIAQFAGGLAHDFNNLLTAINGYAGLALQRANPDDRVKNYLEEIKKAGERAANLTHQLLAFGRRQVLKPVPLNLNDVVSDMTKMLGHLIGEEVELISNCDPGLKRIKADPGQIEQILLNLVVNGREAMPQGGHLTIETTNVEVDEEALSKQLELPIGSYVVLMVSDTGSGMSTVTKARIFEPFFTTKNKEKGNGLGLSTVYGIVKQSGGNICVYSEPQSGTTFRVYLPQIENDSGKFNPRDGAASGGSKNIRLVE
jgi:PAS domain S-box-containing protein